MPSKNFCDVGNSAGRWEFFSCLSELNFGEGDSAQGFSSLSPLPWGLLAWMRPGDKVLWSLEGQCGEMLTHCSPGILAPILSPALQGSKWLLQGLLWALPRWDGHLLTMQKLPRAVLRAILLLSCRGRH